MMLHRDKKIILIILVLLLIIIVSIFKYRYDRSCFEKNQIKALIGEYYIDIERTKISDYDIEEVKSLKLSLRANGTFHFNKDYPFIYDSVGIWSPRKVGLDEWNWMFFNRISEVRCQFADSWKGRPIIDSSLILNSMTPKKGKNPVHIIYLKKMNLDK